MVSIVSKALALANTSVREDRHTRKVMPPQRPDLVLTAHIPNIELCILVRYCLDVEAYGGNGRDVLVELELVEDGCMRVSTSRTTNCITAERWWLVKGERILVLPAASRPSINSRISFDPKILAMALEIEPPILSARN